MRRDEFSFDAGSTDDTWIVGTDFGDPSPPRFYSADVAAEFQEFFYLGVFGSVLIRFDFLDDFVPAECDNGNAYSDTACDEELGTCEEGEDGGAGGSQGSEHAGSHFRQEVADFGESQGNGGHGFGILLEVRDRGRY